MATATPTTCTDPPKPLSRDISTRLSAILSRIRSKRNKFLRNKQEQEIDHRPALIYSPLPLILPQHQYLLPTQGWTSITFPTSPSHSNPTAAILPPNPHPLLSSTSSLFHASAQFFSQPSSAKSPYLTPHGSECGYTYIPGEKEFFTVRTLDSCPEVLREAVERFWGAAGDLLEECLGRIGGSLGLEAEMLKRFVGPCKRVGETKEGETATMLRLFRYEYDGVGKVVAEPHADLGLLSLVLPLTPGLEVWNLPEQTWEAIETQYTTPSATLLCGRQLEALTNGRYRAGGHRVVSYGTGSTSSELKFSWPEAEPDSVSPTDKTTEKQDTSTTDDKNKYRYSIVFVLRAHSPVMINTDDLTTEIMGEFGEEMRDVRAGQLFARIRGKCFNINTGLEEREEQRRRVRTGKGMGERTGRS